jgi:hypothetical protein
VHGILLNRESVLNSKFIGIGSLPILNNAGMLDFQPPPKSGKAGQRLGVANRKRVMEAEKSEEGRESWPPKQSAWEASKAKI